MEELEKIVWATAYVSFVKAGNGPFSAVEQASAVVLGLRNSVGRKRPEEIGPCTARLLHGRTTIFKGDDW